jgi:hypothetical protein
MTNETINKQIKKLNSRIYQDSIFLRPLSSTVYYSSTWTEPSDSDLNSGDSYDIYYIKIGKEYVGAVVDMGQRDLHWYMVPEHRKKGYLTIAMKDIILPHLFQDREEQIVTFSSTDTEKDSLDSEKSANLMGFQKENEEYIIRKSNIYKNVTFLELEPKLSKERYDVLKKRLNTMKNEAAIISAELYMMTNADVGADELKYEVNTVIMNLNDVNYDIN